MICHWRTSRTVPKFATGCAGCYDAQRRGGGSVRDQFIDDLPNVSVLPTQRRPRSIVAMLPMIVIGGGMGLLAGYGALSLMGTKGIGPLKTVPAEPVVVRPPPV